MPPDALQELAFVASAALGRRRDAHVRAGALTARICTAERLLFRNLVTTVEAAGAGPFTVGPRGPETPDLELLEIPRHALAWAERHGLLVLPRLVSLEVDLRRPLERALHRDARRKVRRVQALGYEPEVVRDRAALSELFHDMYLPTMRTRHGRTAHVRPMRHLERGLERGTILMLRRDGRRVAGALNVTRLGDTTAIDHWAGGVLGGERRHVREHADAALLYHSMEWARGQPGVTRFGLTGSYPFLGDGLLRFKKHFGGHLGLDDRFGTAIALRLRRWSAATRAFLARNAPVVWTRGGLVGLTALDDARSSTLADVPCPGLAELFVLSEGPGPELPRGPVPIRSVVVRSDSDLRALVARLSAGRAA